MVENWRKNKADRKLLQSKGNQNRRPNRSDMTRVYKLSHRFTFYLSPLTNHDCIYSPGVEQLLL